MDEQGYEAMPCPIATMDAFSREFLAARTVCCKGLFGPAQTVLLSASIVPEVKCPSKLRRNQEYLNRFGDGPTPDGQRPKA